MNRYYDILELPYGSSKDDIKKAFRRLAMVHHPDRGGNAKKFSEINEAHRELMKDSNPIDSIRRGYTYTWQQSGNRTVDDILQGKWEDLVNEINKMHTRTERESQAQRMHDMQEQWNKIREQSRRHGPFW